MLKIKMKSLAIWFSAITMTVIMSACGGGSGDPILGQNVNGSPVIPSNPISTIAPTVISVTPINGTANVAYNLKRVIAQFSMPMDTATLTTESFTLSTQANPAALIDGQVSYINNVATFAPTADLQANTAYIATVKTLAKSADGIALLSNRVWNFTTGATPDTTAPTGLSNDPMNDATNVAINKNISVIFSEALDPLTVNADTFSLATTNGGTPVEGNVSYSGNTILFNPNTDLAPNTQYTATVTTGVTDLAGNSLTPEKVWNFTTGDAPDTTPPTVLPLSTDPLNNAINVPLNKDINATFSEALDPLTATILNFRVVTTDDSIPVDGVVTYFGETISFNPDTNFEPSMNYTAIITTGVQDLAGNAMASDYNWTFTTAALPLSIVATSPNNNDVNVSYTLKSITAEFSDTMDAATLNTNSFTLAQGNPAVPVTGGTVAYLNKVAELNITTNLLPSTLYTATISTEANSTNGITLSEDYNWTFTTGDINDTTPPEVNSTSPRNGDVNVSITKIVTATFSESMIPSSITAPGTFTLIETDTNISVDGNVSYAVINKIASFNPTLDLATDTNYTAIITTTAKDLAGNEMLVDYNWTFVTIASINPPPPLVALGLAEPFGIAATAGVTNTLTTPTTQIDGDAVLNPTAECNSVSVGNDGTFGLCGGAAPTINGTVITPTNPDTTTAQNITDDLRAAYLSITPANMPGGTAIAAGTTLGAQTGNALVEGDNLFYTGVYTSNTSILVTGDLTLDAQGDPDATFVFQSASTIGSMPNARILLIGGAKASNVYWQAGSDATLQTNSTWNGNIFAYRDITMLNGATSCGRLFAGAFTDGAFVFDSNRISVPGNSFAPTGCE